MVWMAAVGIGLSMLQGAASGKAAANQQRVQAANQYQQTLINHERELKGIQQGLTQQGKQNTAIAKADLQSLINTNFTFGLLNLQRSMQKRQSASDIQRLGETKLQALAQAETSAAASGTIGASVNAVASDIEMKVGEAEVALREQNDMNTMNLGTQIHNLYQGFLDSQVDIDTSIPDIPGMPPQNGAVSVSAGQMALGAGINALGQHLGSMMSLGLGPQTRFDMSSFNSGSLSQSLNTSSLANVSSSFKL